MKNLNIFLAIVLVFVFGSCEQEIPTLEPGLEPIPPCASCPDGADAGSASFQKFVAIGNSFVAGFQAGALFDEGQTNSMAQLLSTQFACAGGSGTFNQPTINSVNGYNVQLSDPAQGVILGRLILYDDGSGAAPAPAGAPGLPPPYDNADLPTPFTGDKAALNNFGVPLIYLGQALTPDTGNPSSQLFNPLWARFASSPGVKSILEDALAAAGSFYLIWLGIDDVLLYAATGADGSFPLTDVAAFELQYNGMISTMLNANPVFKGVLGNIPSILNYPYFTTIPYNSIPLDAATAAGVQAALGDNYNAFLNAMVGAGAITAAERDRRLLNYVEGNNPVLITDESLTDLSEHMVNAGLSQLVPFAQARHTTQTDLIPLSAGAVLGTPYMGITTIVWGVSWPMTDEYALTFDEMREIETNIAGFNAVIDAAEAASGDRLVVADVNLALSAVLAASISEGGYVVDGVSLTSNISPPTAMFSEDGLHPNTRGYAYIGNTFINAINGKFGASVPHLCITDHNATALPIGP